MEESEDRWAKAAVPLDLAVRFAETDLMGVVHHSAYIVWFEAGRVAWLSAAGMPYAEIGATGHHFAVTAVHAEYRAPVRFGDAVRVISRLVKLRSRHVAFAYEVHNVATGERVATGSSEHICVDLDGRMAKIPEEIVARLVAGVEQLAVDALVP